MNKLFLLWVCVACSFAASAQTTLYDYVRIQVSQTAILVITEADTRAVKWDTEKGDLALVERADAARSRAIMRLVKEYEQQGWEVFTVMGHKEESWVMRKPKQ